MKVSISFSVFSAPDTPAANVTGDIDVLAVPGVGDRLGVLFGLSKAMPDVDFSGFLIVETRTFILHPESVCTLQVGDVYVGSVAAAEALLEYFECQFNLYSYRYDET